MRQAVASADVSVLSVSVVDKRRNGLTADIMVHSHHDDDAQQATLIVLLPFQTKVFRVSSKRSIFPATISHRNGMQAFVQSSLGGIPVGATKRVSIATTMPPAASGLVKLPITSKYSVQVYGVSSIDDGDPSGAANTLEISLR